MSPRARPRVPTHGTTGSASTQASSPPSDDDIAAIVQTITRTELDAANIANARAQSSDVKDFAKTMIRNHSTALQLHKAMGLQQKLGGASTGSTMTPR